MASLENVARLAAYIDGEGCISIKKHQTKPNIREGQKLALSVSVCNTDPRLITWLKENFGGITGRVGEAPKRRTKYIWYVHARVAVMLLHQCLPFFIIKKEQAEIAIAFQKTMSPYGIYGRGRKCVLSQEVLDKRMDLASKMKHLHHSNPLEESIQ